MTTLTHRFGWPLYRHISPRLTLAERLGYLFATRPVLRRAALMWLITQLLSAWALAAAPRAAASAIGATIEWTGIADSHGVPLSAYYLSVVSTAEAVMEGGPDLTLNPTSWFKTATYAMTTGLSHQFVSEMLQAQMAWYMMMIALALWLLKFAMSSTWLYWLAVWFRPLLALFQQLLSDLWAFPICLTLGLGVGAYYLIGHNRRGHGWSIMLSAIVIGVLGLYLTHEPLDEIYSDSGLLNQSRNLGFTVAQAFINNGPLASGGSTGQMQSLTGLLTDALVRAPLQLQNFGMVVDGVGNCSTAWSGAIVQHPHMLSATDGQAGLNDWSGPAHAMAKCGAPQALSYAQNLDGANLAPGIFLWVIGLAFTTFVLYVAISYIMVAGAAFINVFLITTAVLKAMIAGKPRESAKRRFEEFVKHFFLVFAYVLYASCAAVIVFKTVAPHGYADQVGMTHPFARMVMIALVSVVAIGLFHVLKKILADHTFGTIVHGARDAYHNARSGWDRGRRHYDQGRELYGKGRDAYDKYRSKRSEAGGDDEADKPVTGEPVNGRPPEGRPPNPAKPRPSHPGRAAQTGGGAAEAGATEGGAAAAEGGATVAAEGAATVVAPEVVAGVVVASKVAHGVKHHRDAKKAQTSNGQGANTTDSAARHRRPPTHPSGPAAELPPTAPANGRTTGPAPQQGRRGQPPHASSYAHHSDTNIPLPEEPPFDDDPGPVSGRR
ncbi:hypothetical protein P5V34_11635 [Mycobacteroides abscessus subsp. abscessus]|jgi:hypothetical protein|uniref:hypothetical protein n=1 Tax=Mycobacteroides abscessus TaxID=36809 RepID=UPI00266CB70A|nr:hypothetical protein [Mycobacteroides abscessus]MDO3014638.1 hypothetical protein [Mycobacteroides abscessus subsp. abscessus]